jgi:hypothetical protein
MTNIFAANIIRVLHFLLVAFLILAPFTKDSLFILTNIVLIVSIMFHWAVNNQTCCLTICEKILRGKELDSETFFGNLVGPVYSANETSITWIFMSTLLIFSIIQLYRYRSDISYKINLVKSVLNKKND